MTEATSPATGEQVPGSGYVDDLYLAKHTPFSRQWYQHARIRREGPPAYRLGRKVVYRWAEVLAWLEASAVKVSA